MLRIIFALLSFSLISSQSWAASYFVENVRSADPGSDLTASIRTLVISAVNDAGGSLADSATVADYSLRTDLVRIGQAYVLTVSRVRGARVETSAHQKAASAEELDEATDHAVRAAMSGKASKNDQRVGEIRPRDRDVMRNRILSRDSHYLGFGPAAFANMDFKGLGYNLAIGHDWEVTPHAAITLTADGVFGSSFSTFLAEAQIGVHLFLTDEDTSPFLGLGAGFGTSAGVNVNAAGGFAASAGLGMEFFRTSSTQLELYASYSTIFSNNSIGAPGVASLRIGILY